jgi:hypothetical protein
MWEAMTFWFAKVLVDFLIGLGIFLFVASIAAYISYRDYKWRKEFEEKKRLNPSKYI